MSTAERLLLLGGTTEAAALARALSSDPDLMVTYSLRGSTRRPAPVPAAVRRGGFGGVEGLVRYLQTHHIGLVVDATHPYATQMSRHAERACTALGVPRLTLTRAPWRARSGDRWTAVASSAEAAALAQGRGGRVLVTLGSGDLEAWVTTRGVQGVVRCIEPPAVHLPGDRLRLLLARGPFTVAGERQLLRETGTTVLVTKNSGGDATYAKLEAARSLGIEVLMVSRPPPPSGTVVHDLPAARAWLRSITGAVAMPHARCPD